MASSERHAVYGFGSFVLDLEWGGLLAEDGKELPLRPKSFALLRMLVENAGRILSHEAIMTELWPDLFVTENNVTQCVHEIRRALGSEAPLILQTLPRRGYRFTSAVIAMPPGKPPTSQHGIARHDGGQTIPAAASELRTQAPLEAEEIVVPSMAASTDISNVNREPPAKRRPPILGTQSRNYDVRRNCRYPTEGLRADK
jgi:DNA-binding winged helix-turn-helix (wHTH) protein